MVRSSCDRRSDAALTSILVPSWNTKDLLLSFLNSVLNQNYPLNKVQLIVVDNGSFDGTNELLKKWIQENEGVFFQTLQILNPENLGVAKAYNQAFDRVPQGCWLVIRAESDVLWPPDLLDCLVRGIKRDSTIGILGVSGLSLSTPSQILNVGRSMNWWNGRLIPVHSEIATDCDCVFGGTFAIRADLLRQLHWFFSGDSFLASELEICLRMRRLGFRVVYDPTITVGHREAASTSRLNTKKFAYICARESFIFTFQYHPWPMKGVFLLRSLAKALLFASRGDSHLSRALIDAWKTHYLKRKPGLPNGAGTYADVGRWLCEGGKW